MATADDRRRNQNTRAAGGIGKSFARGHRAADTIGIERAAGFWNRRENNRPSPRTQKGIQKNKRMRPTTAPPISAHILLCCRLTHVVGQSGDAGDERNQSDRTRRGGLAGVIYWQLAALAQPAGQPSEPVGARGFANWRFFCANMAALGDVGSSAVRNTGEHDHLVNLDRKSVV